MRARSALERPRPVRLEMVPVGRIRKEWLYSRTHAHPLLQANPRLPAPTRLQSDDAKVTILGLIGSGGSEALVQRALDLIFTERVRPQDAPHVFASCTANPIGRDLTWSFFKANWDKIFDQFASGSFLLGNIVSHSTKNFVTEKCAQEVCY